MKDIIVCLVNDFYYRKMDELANILSQLSLSANKSDELHRIKPALSQLSREALTKDLRYNNHRCYVRNPTTHINF